MEVSDICEYIVVFSVLTAPILCLIFLIRWIMGKPKKKKLGIAILVCVGSFVFALLIGTDATQGTNYAAPFGAFVIGETILCAPAIREMKLRRIENIVSARIVGRCQVMVTKKRYTGGSFGLHGGYRWYWTYVDVPGHIKVTVDVVYKDGRQKRLYLREGSRKYYRIAAICENSKETE